MPAIRKPLRERRNVQLNVKTAIPPSPDDYYYYYDDDFARPSRTKTRKACDARIPYTKVASRKCTTVPRLYHIHTPTTEGLSSLHRLVPYIYVGFHDKHLPPSIVSDDGALFTHIIKITPASETHKYKPGHCDLQVDLERGLCCLVLTAPGSVRENAKEEPRKKTVLTKEQLLLARDFMALALPYYAEAHPRADIPTTSADNVRVLVTAPEQPAAAADIMSVVACYLTFASEEPAETVVGYIKIEEDVPEVWKGAVAGREAVGFVAKVARFGE